MPLHTVHSTHYLPTSSFSAQARNFVFMPFPHLHLSIEINGERDRRSAYIPKRGDRGNWNAWKKGEELYKERKLMCRTCLGIYWKALIIFRIRPYFLSLVCLNVIFRIFSGWTMQSSLRPDFIDVNLWASLIEFPWFLRLQFLNSLRWRVHDNGVSWDLR